MENKAVLKEAIVEQAESFGRSLNGNEVRETSRIRNNAIENLRQQGFPNKKNEEYKFTFFTGAVERVFGAIEGQVQSEISKEEIENLLKLPENIHLIVFVNGGFRKDLSNYQEIEGKLNFSDFEEFSANNPGTLEKYLGSQADVSKDAFTAWNSAYANDGLVVQVADNAIIDKPILILSVTDARNSKVVGMPRHLFTIGKNAQVEFLNFYRTIGEHQSLTNEVNEIFLGENACVRHYKVQDDQDQAYAIGETRVYQPSNSTFTSLTVTVSGAMIRNNLSIEIDGEGSEANMFGLYLTKGSTHVDNHTTVDHKQPNSNSNELYKGIMDEKSKGVFNGKIFVRSEAQKTNAFQSNNNILLSDQATVNTKPQLEIWADDVKCSHGCTTGQMDEEAVFYLRSRGISESDARALILKAFASEVIEKINNEWLREYLDQIIVGRLTNRAQKI